MVGVCLNEGTFPYIARLFELKILSEMRKISLLVLGTPHLTD